MNADTRAARAWLVVCVAVGIAIVVLYPGSYYQDPGLHYLRARWMWAHPWMLVDVWDRPMFTLLYSVPAWLPLSTNRAYLAAKVLTVGLTAATARVTWALARAYDLERPALVIPLLWLQPCVALLCGETTPEPLFALLMATGLLLYQRGRPVASLLTASLLVLVRPEGVPLAAMWALRVAVNPRAGRTSVTRTGSALLILVAPVVWWYLAAQITQDPLFIIHDWPPLSVPLRSVFTGGGLESDVGRWSEILGIVLAIPFGIGVATSIWRRTLAVPLSALLVVAVAHILAGGTGVFGWAPVPSEFVCVAPVIAVVTLVGWNVMTRWLGAIVPSPSRAVGWAVAGVVLLVSAVADAVYIDGQPMSRDWQPIASALAWSTARPPRITRVIWSEAYSDILLGHDPTESTLTYGDRAQVLSTLTGAQPGTLVVWDADIGPSWYRVTGADVERIGYIRMYLTVDTLIGRLPAGVAAIPGFASLHARSGVSRPGQARLQETWLLYRP